MFLIHLSIFSFIIYFAFSLVLFFKKSNTKKANNYLAFIFLQVSICLALLIFKHEAYDTGSYNLFKYYFPIIVPLNLIGPFLFLYVREIFDKPVSIISKTFLLQLLVILPGLIDSIYFITRTPDERIASTLANYTRLDWITILEASIFFIQFTAYLLYLYLFIKKEQANVNKTSTHDAHHSKHWIKHVILLDFLLMIIVIPVISLTWKDTIMVPMVLIALSSQCIYIFFKSIWHGGLYKPDGIPVEVEATIKVENKSLPKLIVSEEIADSYIATIEECMYKKQLFLRSNFSIQDLSDCTNISVHHISNCLNVRLQISFSDYINQYRIQKAKQMLAEKDSLLTIEAIGYECGFGSKTNFYSLFKKYVQMTPAEYKKQVHSSLSL